ncbi:MAG: CRISPR-associated endonuclease Cas6 [Candidatus Hodarchaeota archaeon]
MKTLLEEFQKEFNPYQLPNVKSLKALRSITFTSARITTSTPIRHSAHQLRGFFAARYPEFSLLHNHQPDGSRIQGYPKIQYKILGHKAYILGINEGLKLLPILLENLETLTLGSTQYQIIDQESRTQTISIGATHRPIYYQFITPWLALNPNNYQKFHSIYGWKERKVFLNRILIGNCLSIARGLEIFVPYKLYAHTHLDPVEVQFKDNLFIGFVGRFKINFLLPELIGIGKSVSKGYGTIILMPNQQTLPFLHLLKTL